MATGKRSALTRYPCSSVLKLCRARTSARADQPTLHPAGACKKTKQNDRECVRPCTIRLARNQSPHVGYTHLREGYPILWDTLHNCTLTSNCGHGIPLRSADNHEPIPLFPSPHASGHGVAKTRVSTPCAPNPSAVQLRCALFAPRLYTSVVRALPCMIFPARTANFSQHFMNQS